MTAPPAAPVTLPPLPDARRGMTSAWAEPAPVLPLRLAGHFGSAACLARPDLAWAVERSETVRPPTAAERAACEARRTDPAWAWLYQHWGEVITEPPPSGDELTAARTGAAIAALGTEPVAVTRTGGPFSHDAAQGPAPELDEHSEEALGRFESAHHAQYPDVDEPKTPGRHGRKRGLRLRRRQEAGQ